MFEELAAIGGNVASTAWQMDENRKRQHDSQDFAADQFAHRYQTTVNDMKAAGLNPMLAYQQGGGNAPGGSSAGSASDARLGDTMLASRMNSAQVSNVNADTTQKVAQTNLTNASAQNIKLTYDKISAEIDNEKQNNINLKTQADRDSKDATLKIALAQSEAKLQQLYDRQIALATQNFRINEPAALAAGQTGAFKAHSDNLLAPLHNIMGMTRGGARYPKKAGD